VVCGVRRVVRGGGGDGIRSTPEDTRA
jgi:hypothetical protein